jgi:hypothetical protein
MDILKKQVQNILNHEIKDLNTKMEKLKESKNIEEKI